MTMEVAKTIMEQLNMRITEVWAWGSKDFIALKRNNRPALMFSINTPKVKKGGRVVISLDFDSDTYIVEAFTEL